MNFPDNLSWELILMILIFVPLSIYWIFNLIILYHLTHFGIGTQPKKIAAIFFLGSIGLFFVSVILFANVDFGSLKYELGRLSQEMFNLTYPK